jgi:hypothetical protein
MSKKKLDQFLNGNLNQTLYEQNSNKDRIRVFPFPATGTLMYTERDEGWAKLMVDDELIAYYGWFLKRKGVRFELPKGGAHLSLICGEEISVWGEREGEAFAFHYGDLVTNGKHWWLEVHSPPLEAFRVSLGLPPRPRSGLHVTVGRIKM